MRITVKAIHVAVVRRKRAREFKKEPFLLAETVDIREMSSAEAPVVVRCKVPVDERFAGQWGDLMTVEFREVDGKLFSRFESGKGETCDAAWLAQAAGNRKNVPDGESRDPFRSIGYSHWKPNPPIAECGAILSETQSSEHDLVTAQLHQRATETVLIDGELWQACPEPVLVVHYNRNDDLRAFTGVVLRRPESHMDKSDKYRLDQADQVAESYRSAEMDVVMPDIEIFDPSVLRLRTDEHALLAAGQRLVKTMSQHLESRSVAHLTTYGLLRDALQGFAEAVESASEAEVDEFAALAAAAASAYGGDNGVSGAVWRIGATRERRGKEHAALASM